MYHALYRKYRPHSFDDVVGQDVIVKTLKNAIEHKNFSHAYMFFGPRGVGKTTVSKILARAVNCLDPINGNCCEKCDNCLISLDRDCIDIIEMDAASNNGVDEIRELKNNAMLVPSQLKFKVYIIDEVHMLSIGAFNALLKILEEPPEHIIFILATTDPQKVPETIVSRCQCFSFKKISLLSLIEKLRFVCSKEKILIDDNVLNEIARISDGGLRDALGILDKLKAYKNENEMIELSDFYELNDMIGISELEKFTQCIFQKNMSELLRQINLFDSNGKNIIEIASQLMYFLRDMLVDYYISGTLCPYELNDVETLTSLLCEKMFDIKKGDNPRISFELLLLGFVDSISKNDKIISREINSNQDTVINNTLVDVKNAADKDIDDYHEKINNLGIAGSVRNDSVLADNNIKQKIPNNIEEIMIVRVNNTLALADKSILRNDQQKFELLKDYTFDKKIGYLVCSLLDGKIRASSTNNIIISFEYDSIVKKNLEIIDKISAVFNKITNSNKKLAFISDDVWNEEKSKYISAIRSGKNYTVMEEPKELFDDLENDDIIQNEAVKLFGDLVEFN